MSIAGSGNSHWHILSIRLKIRMRGNFLDSQIGKHLPRDRIHVDRSGIKMHWKANKWDSCSPHRKQCTPQLLYWKWYDWSLGLHQDSTRYRMQAHQLGNFDRDTHKQYKLHCLNQGSIHPGITSINWYQFTSTFNSLDHIKKVWPYSHFGGLKQQPVQFPPYTPNIPIEINHNISCSLRINIVGIPPPPSKNHPHIRSKLLDQLGNISSIQDCPNWNIMCTGSQSFRGLLRNHLSTPRKIDPKGILGIVVSILLCWCLLEHISYHQRIVSIDRHKFGRLRNPKRNTINS